VRILIISQVIIAIGEKKAPAIVKAIEGGINHLCPASVLQLHPDVMFACDDAALSKLGEDTVALLVQHE
jgi:glucosamine-6-phosphate deaminase